MRHKLISALGLIVLGWAMFAAVPAEAAGPYYAMPSWDQTFKASTRFIVLTNMSSHAVLDQETGLVWEQSPGTKTRNWEDAQFHCNELTKGGRLGWRLPTLQELDSLVDPTQSLPALPAGHPFSNVQSDFYWSATTYVSDTSWAWGVNFAGASYFVLVTNDVKSDTHYGWCARGGQGVDPQ